MHADSGLTSVTIPGSVTSIGGSAFFGCNGLTSITSLIPGENLCKTDLGVSGITIYIPVGTTADYENMWGTYNTYVEMSSGTVTNVVSLKDGEPALEEVYDLNGRSLGNRTTGLRKGVYVFVYSDGSSRKVLVK